MATINAKYGPLPKRKAPPTGKNDKMAIVPYHKHSRSFKNLAKTLDLSMPTVAHIERFVIEQDGTSKPNKKIPLLINWGSGNIPGWMSIAADKILNTTQAVNICRNKTRFFEAVKETVRIPDFTTDFDLAMSWVKDGKIVMGRQANGSCGTDIVFYEDNPGDFQRSEFWVQYKKKKHEFRVHVFDGAIISLQQKAIRTTDENGQNIPAGTIDFRIRNHKNGFIFKRNEITVPDDVKTQAVLAVKAIPGLTFGAVDVIYNQHEDKAYVLEVNTAPGLEGTTLDDYTKAFLNY